MKKVLCLLLCCALLLCVLPLSAFASTAVVLPTAPNNQPAGSAPTNSGPANSGPTNSAPRNAGHDYLRWADDNDPPALRAPAAEDSNPNTGGLVEDTNSGTGLIALLAALMLCGTAVVGTTLVFANKKK